MYIKMKNIQQLFSEFCTKLSQQGEENCISGFHDLETAPIPYEEHFVYVATDPAILPNLDIIDNQNLLIIIPDHIEKIFEHLTRMFPTTNILFIQASDTNVILQKLQKYLHTNCAIGQFSHSLLDHLLHEIGIQSMVDRAYGALLNPIYVFDASFKLIAATWDAAAKTEQGKHIVENGGMREKEFKLINRNNHHVHKKVMQQDRPIKIFNEVLGCEQLLCAIDTHKDLGHIVVDAVDRPFSEIDEEILFLLKAGIDQQLKKDEFIRNNRGFHYEYYIKDLLDGKIATSKQYMERMNYAGAEFSGNLYCLVIETARSADIINVQRIRNTFEQIFPTSKILNYNGQIIIVICLSVKERLLKKHYQKAENICIEYGLFAGISNCFNSIIQIREYYRQALRAIEIGIESKNTPSLFSYQNYYLKHITNLFMQKESSDTFCHPELKKLIQYDTETNGNLAQTLYCYLTNERNIATTATKLKTHRNTIVYRLKRIDELAHIDYDNYDERHYLILSYELYENGS